MADANAAAHLLEVDSVSVHFGGVAALQNVDLRVKEGSTHCIIGPNGAGKSTLVNVLTGQIRPDEGHVRFAGQSLDAVRPHDINQRGIARVFQSPSIFDEMSLRNNVAIAALAKRDGKFRFNLFQPRSRMASAWKQADEKLDAVGLADQRHTEAEHLSRGDKRRLELAICLAAEPRLLLLDEPTAGMSRHETESTIELLKQIASTGVTKVVIEHDMHLVFSLAERLSVLHQGSVIAEGTPDEVRNNQQVVEAYLGGARE
ncbi:MAG: ABC transporter ATP-binding protein [Halofilum sp. (in: g-proteobacteria)]|nr:ABC transporter ATP-binding protein [Halofilum sp. (in: g-proteobacteria)]